MIQFFCVLLFLCISFSAQSHTSDVYNNTIADSHCGFVFMDFLHPFNVTKTHSKSLFKMMPPSTPVPPVISVAVTATAGTVGHVASLASIAAISPSVVTQASRIGTVTSVLACDDGSAFDTQPLDWSLSPTQISLGDGMLQYVDGAVLGNWMLFSGIAIIHTLLAKKWGEAQLRYPGFMILPALFLFPSTARSAVTMMRLGSGVEQALGSISFVGQLGIIGGLVRLLMPSRFGAVIKHEPGRPFLAYLAKAGAIGQFLYALLPVSKEETLDKKWRSKEENSHFMQQYGPVFRDYRQGWYAFMVPELCMTMASGTLDSFQIDPKSSCENLLYAATGVYGVYAASLLVLHPHRYGFNRIYFGSVASIQFLALAIGSIQKGVPSLQNNTALQAAAEGIPVALQYVTLLRSLYDIAFQVRGGYKYYNWNLKEKISLSQMMEEPNHDDKEMSLIQINEEFNDRSSQVSL